MIFKPVHVDFIIEIHLENFKLCEKKFQIFQIFENDFSKSLEINERRERAEGIEPSVTSWIG